MKTNLKLITLLLAVSCVKAPNVEPNQQESEYEYTPMTFRAETENVTRVSLGNDKVTLSWQQYDQIKIFDGSSAQLDPFVSTVSGTTTDFVGNVVNAKGPFYALYPYQQEATMDHANGVINAELPAVQKAVAGSVPSEAFIAVAKAVDGVLTFKSVLGYIRFKLDDNNAANIVSMTLSGNNGEELTGGLKITFDSNGNASDQSVSGNVHNYVTLTGPFVNGKDYIFAIRAQQSFTNGVTISVLYKDGNRRYISSESNFVDAEKNSIAFGPNMVLNISTLEVSEMKSTMPTDRYVAYLHGWELTIADEKYNMAKNGEPILVKAPDGGSVGVNKLIKGKQSGMFFLDSSLGECQLETHTVVAGDHVALVGRYKDKPNAFTPRAYIELRGGNFLMSDLDVDLQNVKFSSDNSRITYFIVIGTTLSSDATQGNHIESIVIDSCKVRNVWKNLIEHHQQNTVFSVKNIKIINSDIEIDKTYKGDNVVRIVNFTYNPFINIAQNIVFDRNIVFHNYENAVAPQTCRVVDINIPTKTIQENGKDRKVSDCTHDNAQSWNTEISFCNNTMYNVATPHGHIKFHKVSSLKMNKNICVVSEEWDHYSGYMCWLCAEHDDSVIDVSDNLYFGLNNKKWNVTNEASLWKPSPNDLTKVKLSATPFANVDYENFTFTQKTEYADYGAKR